MNPIHYSRAEREDADQFPTRQPGVEVIRHGFHKPGQMVKGRRVYIVGPAGQLLRVGKKRKHRSFKKPQ